MSSEKFRPYIPLFEVEYPLVYLDVPSFLGSKVVRDKNNLKECDVVFIGAPWEGEITWGSWSGCQLAPMHVRRVSLRYGGFIPEFNIDVLAKYRICDYGDACIDPDNQDKTFNNIYRKVYDVLEFNSIPIVVGGDHSITVPVVKAIVEKGFNPLILHFDAHYDNLPSYKGNKYARCCPIRRIIEDLGVNPDNVFQIGVRGPRNAKISKEYADSIGVHVYTIWDLRKGGFTKCINEIIEKSKKCDGVYITICMDVLDSSAAPASAGDPMGLTSYELIDMLVNIVNKAKLLGMDIVELYPPIDVREMTSHLAVWIVLYTLAARFLEEK